MIAIAPASASTTSIWWVEKIRVRPRAASSRKAAPQERDVDRIEAGERLVHQHHLRIVEDRRDELDLLLVAFAELVGPAAGQVGHPEALEPAEGVAPGIGARDAIQAGEEDELVEDPHPGIEAALLGQVAERAPGQLGARPAAPGDRARCRPAGCRGRSASWSSCPRRWRPGSRRSRRAARRSRLRRAPGPGRSASIAGRSRESSGRGSHTDGRCNRSTDVPAGPLDRAAAPDAYHQGMPSATDPARIHADRAAGTLTIEWRDEHHTTYPTSTLRWLCPCAYCRGEAGPAGLARLGATPDLRPGSARRHRPGRPVRRGPDLGRRAPYRLLHVHDPARDVPLRRMHRGPGRRRPA